MNKNNVIVLLFIAVLIGSTWGSVVNRQKIDLERQLSDVRAELNKPGARTGGGQGRVPGKTAGVQDNLAAKEAQLVKAGQEIDALRKEAEFLAGKLAGCNGAVQELTGIKQTLEQQLQAGRESAMAADPAGKGEGARGDAGAEVGSPQEQSPVGGQDTATLRHRLDVADAQLLGLEKIIDDNKAALREADQEKERLRINMDVLLAKISDQQRELRAIQEENRELVKQLASRKEQAALRDQQQSGNQ